MEVLEENYYNDPKKEDKPVDKVSDGWEEYDKAMDEIGRLQKELKEANEYISGLSGY